MRNGLQYLYSITVFIGVIATAYMMMNKEGNARIPYRAVQTPSYRTEATMLDPGMNQLFQMEDQFSKLPSTEPDKKRAPSESPFPKK